MSKQHQKRKKSAFTNLLLATIIGTAIAGPAYSQSIPTEACPVFHCNAESTGVMNGNTIDIPTTVTSNNTLGILKYQGCSGDGKILACLYATDNVTSGLNQGTLKILNASDLTPIWGSAGTVVAYGNNGYAIDVSTVFGGQTPVIFANGNIAAGDGYNEVLYAPDGKVIGKIPLQAKKKANIGIAKNMGLTPIADDLGIITLTNGTLYLINTQTWQKVGDTLILPAAGGAISLNSPSSGTKNTLYAVGTKDSTGYLYAVNVLDNNGQKQLNLHGTFNYVEGAGASVVVLTPEQTGLNGNLILLAIKGLPEDGTTLRPRLMGILDTGTELVEQWRINLKNTMAVSPTIDIRSQSIFIQEDRDVYFYRHSYIDGALKDTYNIQALSELYNMKLNGHVLSTVTEGGDYKLLLSASVEQNLRKTIKAENLGQFAISIKPNINSNNISTPTLDWKIRVSPTIDQHTAAWSLGPSNSNDAIYCPIVVGTDNGLSKICD